MSGPKFVPEPGKGRLFDNKIDRTSERQPDYTGTASCPCCSRTLRISAWHNPPSERQRVSTYGLQLQDWQEWNDEREEKRRRQAERDADGMPSTSRQDADDRQPPQGDFDDDIPF